MVKVVHNLTKAYKNKKIHIKIITEYKSMKDMNSDHEYLKDVEFPIMSLKEKGFSNENS